MTTKRLSLSIKALLHRIAPLFAIMPCFISCHSEFETPISAFAQDSTTSNLQPETAHSAYDFINSIGANTHLSYFDRLYGNFPFVEHELTSIGIRHLRDGVHLQNHDYEATLYGRFDQLGKLGIRFDAVVDPRNNLGPITPQLLQRVYDLSGHSIESFEGPNELDISNVGDWSNVDRSYNETLFRAVRAMPNGAGVQVVSPSMAFASHGSAIGDLSRSIDFGNLHSYPAGKLPSVIFPEQTIFARQIAGNRQVYVTESGYHNALNDHTDQPAVSETAAAKYIPRLFLENFAHGIPRTFLYEFLDEAADPSLKDNQLHWGLIRANQTEKPAFTSMKNLIAVLNDSSRPNQLKQLSWSLNQTDGQIHHLLLQKANGEFDLVLWQEVRCFDTKQQADISNAPVATLLRLSTKPKSVTLYDPVQQAGPIRTYQSTSQIPVEIPDHPLVVRILMP